MNKIQVKVLNPDVVLNAEKMMVAMARLTQKGHSIKDMSDLEELIEKPYTNKIIKTMIDLPHPTIQKFGVINVAILGASRRFLAQITRHQNEVKYMSGSLQYSDYSNQAKFVVPYELTEYDAVHGTDFTEKYLQECQDDLVEYEELAKLIGKDAAGYKMPQGMRNILIISATPYQLKHMICQRTCNRNTLESQYVMALVWKELHALSSMYYNAGPFCTTGPCPEGKFCCNDPFESATTPTSMIESRFKYLKEV